MRLSKILFIAAAATLAFSASRSSAVDIRTDGEQTAAGDVHAQDSIISDSATWTITANYGDTTTGRWLSDVLPNIFDPNSYNAAGTIIVTGKGTLEYQGWQKELNDTQSGTDGGFFGGRTFITNGSRVPTYMNDFVSKEGVKPGTTTAERGAFAGSLYVQDAATLIVSGYLNQYRETSLRVVGVEEVILKDSATLSFQNSLPNIFEPQPPPYSLDQSPLPVRLRYNLVQNLQSDASKQTTLDTGRDDTYRIGVHVETGVNTVDPMAPEPRTSYYGVGQVRGRGELIKTGGGDFEITNDTAAGSGLTGRVYIASGTLILSSAGGRAIAEAESVTFGIFPPADSPITHNVAGGAWFPSPTAYLYYFPTLAPTASAGVANEKYAGFADAFTISTDQKIRNFQSCYVSGALPHSWDEPMWGWAGSGDVVDLQSAALTIVQDLNWDGEYAGRLWGMGPQRGPDGNVVEEGSIFIKQGPGVIALTGSAGTLDDLPERRFSGLIDIQEGAIYSNVQTLGFGRVNIGVGTLLKIVQINSGTLNAELSGALGGELLIGHQGTLNTIAGTRQIGDAHDIGFAEIHKQQPNFFGNLTVEDGVYLSFTATSSNAFVNAHAVHLTAGPGAGRETTLHFADSNQTFNNFSGDPQTRVELGRGTITVRQSEVEAEFSSFSGQITGVGNLILLTNSNYSLRGNPTYFGATVVQKLDDGNAESRPALNLNSSGGNTIRYTSGVVLYTGTSVNSTEPQTFGALFGERGSVVNMGSADLTIGVDEGALGELVRELASLDARSPDPQPAYFLNTLQEGPTQGLPINPQIADFTAGTSRNYLKNGLAELTSEKQPLRDAYGEFLRDEEGEILWTVVTPGRGLANADELAFAGQIVSSGKLIHIGTQRLTLTAVHPDFTGAVEIQGGRLRINYDSLPAAQGVTISAGGRLEVNVAAGSSNAGLPLPVVGDGDFSKVGAGELTLYDYTYKGNTYVENGALRLAVKDTLGDIILGGFSTTYDTFNVLVNEATAGTVIFEVPGGNTATHRRSITDRFAENPASVGHVVKEGEGKLILAGDSTPGYSLNYHGTTTVRAGELVFTGSVLGPNNWSVANLPPETDNFVINGGAKLTLDVATEFTDARAPGIRGDISGAGTFEKTGGGDLNLYKAQPDFSGAFLVSDGDLSLRAAEVLTGSSNVWIGSGARVLLNGNDQWFKNLSGEKDAELIIGTATVTFGPTAGQSGDVIYNGKINGTGGIVKEGTGTVVLHGDNVGIFSGPVTVNRGILEVTTQALGSATATVTGNSVLRFYSDNVTADDTQADIFYGKITGIGTLAKNGAGTVWLAWESAPEIALPAIVEVAEGKLIIDSARNANAIPQANVGTVDPQATLQINLTSSVAYGGQVKGLGNLIIDGQWLETGVKHTLRLDEDPRYSGVTSLQNGAILDASLRDMLPGGIGTDETSVVRFGNDSTRIFYINQSADADFRGALEGRSQLMISGPGTLRYVGPDHTGNLNASGAALGDVTVLGGNLQVGIRNGHDLQLKTNEDGIVSTLYVNVRPEDADIVYGNSSAVKVLGTGNIIKTGPARLDVWNLPFLDSSANPGFTVRTLGVNDGILVVDSSFFDRLHGWFNSNNRSAWNDVKLRTYGNGILEWNAIGNSTLEAARLSGEVGGVFLKSGDYTLTLDGDASAAFKGTIRVASGTLKGGNHFHTGGNLVNEAFLSAGNTPDSITVDGDFTQTSTGTLDIVLDGGSASAIIYGGKAVLDGTVRVIANTDRPERGREYPFIIKAGGGAPEVTVAGSVKIEENVNNVNEKYVLVGPGIGVGTVYSALGQGGPALFVSQKELGRVSGFSPHDGLKNFLGALDSVIALPIPMGVGLPAGSTQPDVFHHFKDWVVANRDVFAGLSGATREGAAQLLTERLELLPGLPELDNQSVKDELEALRLGSDEDKALRTELLSAHKSLDAAYTLSYLLNRTETGRLSTTVNNLSPLGYASLVAMPASAASASAAQLHAHLEQRRYDRAAISEYSRDWEFYVTASGNFAENGKGGDDPVFNFNTYGGTVGADNQLSRTNLVGVALDYTNGKATLHNGGGSISMNAVHATGYWSHIFNDWFFMDSGVAFGYATYDARRDTILGRNKASPDGWNAGVFTTAGTIFPIQSTLHLNPYVGLEYNHYEVGAFTEKGSGSRLKVDNFGYDSLRAKIGTGLSWFVGKEWDLKWKFTLDVAYAHELLDTDADVTSKFALDPSVLTRNKVSAKALPSDVVQFGPSVTLSLDERSSIFLSYRLEIGFDGGTYNNINLGFRTR
ncbi:MAG: autotransporter domain-containing protein, partial [Puniceicoccales bacterium]|nr:autotransporter domain-containing protein [Puniceicoccales bacterium]